MTDYTARAKELIQGLNERNKRNRLTLKTTMKGDEIVKYTLYKNATILSIKYSAKEIYEIVEILNNYNY